MERKIDNNPGEPMKVSSQGTIKVHAIRDIMDKVGQVLPLAFPLLKPGDKFDSEL